MKKDLRLVVFLVFFLIILSSLGPTTTYATNGHQLSAVGAYQEGMAGATTAAPYDSSTSISNPAGMAMIGNRTDFSFMTFFPSRQTAFGLGGGTTEGGSGMYLVPAIGWTAPVNDRGDLFFGGGMYGVSGMGVDYDTVSAPFA
ncbi:MAG TPA: aromatic hydrocarbon degradation protein, partial [Nitrospirota bacterium]|nr:aromatic hydrocarbon degradation protein [Nitrospirota bacterium]